MEEIGRARTWSFTVRFLAVFPSLMNGQGFRLCSCQGSSWGSQPETPKVWSTIPFKFVFNILAEGIKWPQKYAWKSSILEKACFLDHTWELPSTIETSSQVFFLFVLNHVKSCVSHLQDKKRIQLLYYRLRNSIFWNKLKLKETQNSSKKLKTQGKNSENSSKKLKV